ncbi:MAG: hypothetical protein ACRC0G_15325 [Fusobacteriaceae bacterium]
MIFSINENGDLDIDEENGSVCNEIKGDLTLSNFKTSKTIILTYFKHNGNLKNKFYKNKRNTLTDEQIKSFFNKEVAEAFAMRTELIKFIKYEFINDKSSFNIMFYFYSESFKKIILNFNLDI